MIILPSMFGGSGVSWWILGDPKLELAHTTRPFGDDVDFYEYRTQKKEDHFSRLEWRTQFKPLEEVVTKKRESRWEEKTRRRDKSSDAHFVHDELIRTIHSRATDPDASTDQELSVLTKLSFLEKYIGFTN